MAYLTASIEIPASHSVGKAANCPRSAPHSIGGFFKPRRPDDGVVWTANLTADDAGSHWWLSGGFNGGAFPSRPRLGLICSSGATNLLGGIYGYVRLAAGQLEGGIFTCPRATPRAVTPYWGTEDPRDPPLALAEAVSLNRRQMRVRVMNVGIRRTAGLLGVFCGRPEYPVAEARESGSVNAGEVAVVHGICPRSRPNPVAPRGVATEGGAESMLLSYWWPSGGRRWELGIRNRGTTVLRYTAGSACVG